MSASAPRVGLTLPAFREDIAPLLDVARAAEAAGLDGVFTYDHLFRLAADGGMRPALELAATFGALAVETSRITIGSLVARATLRPPAVLANLLASVVRIAGARVVAGIGAGDGESRSEMETFGLAFGDLASRLDALDDAVRAVGAAGIPVWVGGQARHVGAIAARHADGWNRWGAPVDRFAAEWAEVQARAEGADRDPATLVGSWGGLVVLGDDDGDAAVKAARLGAGPHVLVGGPERVADALRAYADAGAAWLVVGPVDSSEPYNAAILAEGVVPLLG